MWVVWEACSWGHAEMIEHEERCEMAQCWCTDAAAHCCASTFGLLAGKESELDASWSRHVVGVCGRGSEAGWYERWLAEGRCGCAWCVHCCAVYEAAEERSRLSEFRIRCQIVVE